MGGNPVTNAFVPFQALNVFATMPTYGSEEAAGADLYANLWSDDIQAMMDPFEIPAGERRLIKTGVALELPPGFWAKIEGRSGLAYKSGICILGGVIDSDYRGDIGVIMLNTGARPFPVKHGDRIAQLVIQPYARGVFSLVEKLADTRRAAGGFGSTGT